MAVGLSLSHLALPKRLLTCSEGAACGCGAGSLCAGCPCVWGRE